MAVVGAISVAHSTALSLGNAGLDRAYRLAPWDGRITARLSAKIAGPEAGRADRARADTLARDALRHDPTAVDAVATLGLDTQLRGDTAAARRLLGYSQALSRRDLRTQLWAVEDAVARGDVAATLTHYDIALRTSRAAPDLLFPILAAAIGEPAIRAGLIPMLAKRVPWGSGFTDYLGGNGPSPQTTAALFRDLHRAAVPVSDGAQAAVINALVAKGSIGDAWTQYAVIHPGADRARSRDPYLRNPIPSAFDWVPTSDAAVSAVVQRGERGGVFDFAVPTSVGGPLLSQLQVLPPGAYALAVHSSGIEQSDDTRPYWALTCRDGRELGRAIMPDSARSGGAFTARFQVPADCPVQALSFVAVPSDKVSGLSGQIDRVQLRPTT